MIVRKPRPKSNFYMLDKAISEDSRLTWAARGLLVFLLGKPDHWQVSTQALINETKKTRAPIGRDGVRAILGELMAAGYVHRFPARDASGKLAGYDYSVSEECTAPESPQPATAEPGPAEPAPANPPLVSIESLARTDLVARIDLSSQAPSALAPQEVLPASAKPAKTPKVKAESAGELDTELQAACRTTWAAYLTEYRSRYGIDPVRNAKVNSNVKEFVKRIGHDEAPGVAAFYVRNVSEAFVVRSCHALGMLLQNAEAYRTQWATGQAMTATRAQQADKTQTNFDAAQGAKALLRARREQRNAE